MPNPYGTLAGFSDPEEEGWEERLQERVANNRSTKKRKSERTSGMYLFFDEPFRGLLHEAARQRDISITGYGRRATGAFIAHDLGLAVGEVLHHSAQPAPYQNRPGGTMRKSNDNGQGHGLWIIDGLVTP